MDSDRSTTKVSRRGFLDVLLGIGVVGAVASALFPIYKYLTPLPRRIGGAIVKLTKDQVQKLMGRKRSVIVRAGGEKVIVFDDPQGKVRALNAKCTHEGCTVQYKPGDGVIWCACHNGFYDLDGRVISGPPPRPLARYAVNQSGDEEISIDTTKSV